ncbi:hypothetical protein IAR55_002749 [Kwoniella newhampshirensis]|uniref:CN hydrolase domain-containing protein n=1 Tax=Kwoniella newhampshirensis TaxID=1651941 RepID=A0AAW0Z034_9TREE
MSSRRNGRWWSRIMALPSILRLFCLPVLPGQLWSKSLKVLTSTLLLTYGLLLAVPVPPPMSLSSHVDLLTPLSVRCVLPPASKLSQLDSLIHSSETLGAHAKLIVWPEGSLRVNSMSERTDAVERVRRDISRRYGLWVVMSLESEMAAENPGHKGKIRKNEAVLVGPDGEMGSYEKQKLVPLVESYSIDKGGNRAPVWPLDLPPPAHVTKPDWRPSPPHRRSVAITPLICLDTFHPSLMAASSSDPASLLVVPASSPGIRHGIPSLVCSTSIHDSGTGLSTLIDSWGRIMYQQTGGDSFVVKVGIPYPGQDQVRSTTTWERLGARGVLGIWAGVLILGIGFQRITKRHDGVFVDKWNRLADMVKEMWRRRVSPMDVLATPRHEEESLI